MNGELVIGVVALVVAGVSAYAAWRTSQRQVALQERLLALEHGRERERKAGLAQAQVQADMLPASNHSYKLRVRNEGPGQARALRVLVDGEPLGASKRVRARGEDITTLGAGADVKYHVVACMGMNPVFHIRLEWVDDSASHRVWESQLKI